MSQTNQRGRAPKKSPPANSRRGRAAPRASQPAPAPRGGIARYAAVAMLVVLAFFAAYSYAAGSSGNAQGGSVAGQPQAYDEYGNPVGAGGQPGLASGAYGGTGANGGAAAGGGGCCGGGGGGSAAAAGAGGGGCCGGGGPQKEIKKTATLTGGAQVIDMTVNGNYNPNVIVAKAGVPLTIKIDHPSAGGCDGTLVFPDFGIQRQLPPNGKDEITFTPTKAGTYRFTCGMGMLSGKLVVE